MSRVKGLKALLSELRKLPEIAEDDLAKAVQNSARSIAQDAKIRAPKDRGDLQQNIQPEQGENRLTWNVTSYMPYSAYVEFGTGGEAKVPSELASQASKWQGLKAGSFDEGLDSIKGWCKRHGIPESAAYPIFMSILKKGLKPQPFLYPALVAGRKRFLNEVKRLVNKLGSKI